MIPGAEMLLFSNGAVEVGVAMSFGPRVLRFARPGGVNLLGEVSPQLQGKDTPFGGKWHLYGGHRLWYAPESDPGSYFPDNARVEIAETERSVTMTQAMETHSGLVKSITVTLDPEAPLVRVSHRLEHRGANPMDLAPWALTIMAAGGLAIFPHPPFAPHPEKLAPSRPMVMWPFTRMLDPRWRFGDRFVTLRHDTTRKDAQKIGLYDADGWMAYAHGDQLFVKMFDPQPGPHADFGCNVETFTNDLILELETLGPLVRLAPGGVVTHEEQWALFSLGAGSTFDDDDRIDRFVMPLVAQARALKARTKV